MGQENIIDRTTGGSTDAALVLIGGRRHACKYMGRPDFLAVKRADSSELVIYCPSVPHFCMEWAERFY